MRKFTNKIIEMIDEGILDRDILIRDLLCWMSEHDVEEFYNHNGFDLDYEGEDEDDEDEEDDLDGPDEQRAWYDTSAELM